MDETYIEMLKQEFLDRKQRRSQYSERAFARDLELSSGFISLLFNRKRSLSPRTGLKIVKKLRWSELKTERFLDSVQKAQFFTQKKNDVQKKEREIIPDYEVEMDRFRLISNTHHFSILELIQTRKIKSVDQIIKKLKLQKTECEVVLSRLIRLNLIQFDGKCYTCAKSNRRINGAPSEAIRQYHHQVLELAIDSIESQSFEQRDLKSLTLSLDPQKIKQAKKTLSKFFTDFNKKFGNQENGEIYQLNMQLFSHFKQREES